MPNFTLPDGKILSFDQPVTALEVAKTIGSGLAKAMLAAEINGRLVDASRLLSEDGEIRILTEKNHEGLEVIRHSCAHLLAQAAKAVFPEIQVTIGPVIEDGFFYDFASKSAFTPEDLEKIEAKMTELSKQDLTVTRAVWDRPKAIKYFESLGEAYKAEIIRDLPEDEEISVYQQGDFVDLCRGPHVPSTGRIKAFKLTKLAGAYWRGDSNNEMLQRVYGTAWANQKDLDAYLERIEEAERRDHRKTAKRMDLFHVQPEAPGMIFWHAAGWSIYQTLRDYIRRVYQRSGYQEIHTPIMADQTLWEKSGHWEKFQDDMFVTESEGRTFAIKPMSCPCHIQVFNQGLRSYRDLPLRLAEFGCCHRNELSGALHGLMRVRGLTQDDGHIFCTEDQVMSEVSAFISQLEAVYKDFGFDRLVICLSTRPEKRVGSDIAWNKAEQALTDALDARGIDWTLLPGEGAFYGPKIEFHLKDCIGRQWQCGTIQLDFSMPERLGATYIAEDGSRQTPVMLHRAILGSLERFIGILLEEYADGLPVWLSPEQVVICPVADQFAEYAQTVEKQLMSEGIRGQCDLRNEKVGYKIREHAMARVSYILVVGERETTDGTVSVRALGGHDLGVMPLDNFVQKLHAVVDGHLMPVDMKEQ